MTTSRVVKTSRDGGGDEDQSIKKNETETTIAQSPG